MAGPSPLLDEGEEHLTDLGGQLAGRIDRKRLVGTRERVAVHAEMVEDAALHAPPGGILRVDREHPVEALKRLTVLPERVQGAAFQAPDPDAPGVVGDGPVVTGDGLFVPVLEKAGVAEIGPGRDEMGIGRASCRERV